MVVCLHLLASSPRAPLPGLVGDAVAKQPALEQLRAATEAALTKARGEEVAAGASSEGLLNAARDVLVKWLDSQHGAGLTDHSIFSKLTLEFEASFLADMVRENWWLVVLLRRFRPLAAPLAPPPSPC